MQLAAPRRLQRMFTDWRMRPLILALWFSVLSIAVIAVSRARGTKIPYTFNWTPLAKAQSVGFRVTQLDTASSAATSPQGDAEGASPSCDQAFHKSRTLLMWQRPDGDREPRTVLDWDKETLSTLSDIHSKIAVVSIAGPQRSGKSYFLNRLAKLLQPSSDPTSPEKGPEESDREWEDPFDTFTTGGAEISDVSVYIIPACANPLPDRPDTALLLLDTPGMRTLQRSALQDAQVMALVEAVSSVVLYNTFSVVERTDFQLLSTALETSRALDVLYAIHDDSGDEKEDEAGGVEDNAAGEKDEVEEKRGMINRPSLVWLLQQSTFKADNDDQVASAKYYVDGLLDNAWDGETFKNSFSSFFTECDAAALPKPLTDAERWPVLNTVSESELSDEYTKSVDGLVKKILSSCAPKMLDGIDVAGKDLVNFLRRFSKEVNVQIDDEDLESPTVLLEALEDQELHFAKNYFEIFFEDKLPLDSVGLENVRKEVEDFIVSQFITDPRSAPEENRREAFVTKLFGPMSVAYKDTCKTNAFKWSAAEVADLKEEFKKLGQPDVQDDHQKNDVANMLEVREKRWRGEIADKISDSELEHSFFAKDGGFASVHVDRLRSAAYDFLNGSLDVKNKDEDEDEEVNNDNVQEEEIKGDTGDGQSDPGKDEDEEVNNDNVQEEEIKGDTGDGQSDPRKDEDEEVNKDNVQEEEIKGDTGDGQSDPRKANPVGEDVYALAKRLAQVNYKSCILKIEPNDLEWNTLMELCKRSVDGEWKTSEADRFVLDKALDKVEKEHIKSYLKTILEKEVDGHVPLYKQTRDMHKQAIDVNAREDEKGMLVDLKSESRLENFSTIVIDEVWTKKCKEAGKKHIKKAKAATSIFSLAPLRYFGAVPFQPADCLKGNARVPAAEDDRDKARSKYYRGSWLRRYFVTLSLVCTFVLTLVAVALLVAGRQLQHRQVTMAFVAATAFHVIVLCLAVSDGLVRGTRLWLLVSAGLLGYVASGSTVSIIGGKRGRGSTRYPVWSAVGIRRWTGFSNGGSLMPLFRDSGVSGRGEKVSRERDSRTRRTD